MAQGGDPTGTGTGGSSKPNLKAEFSDEPHRARRLLHGARAEPELRPTASSSSASTTRDFLDGQYTVWGKVVEGMEHVDRIKRGEPVQQIRTAS